MLLRNWDCQKLNQSGSIWIVCFTNLTYNCYTVSIKGRLSWQLQSSFCQIHTTPFRFFLAGLFSMFHHNSEWNPLIWSGHNGEFGYIIIYYLYFFVDLDHRKIFVGKKSDTVLTSCRARLRARWRVAGMLEGLGLKHEGHHHSGLDDCRNIARTHLRAVDVQKRPKNPMGVPNGKSYHKPTTKVST